MSDAVKLWSVTRGVDYGELAPANSADWTRITTLSNPQTPGNVAVIDNGYARIVLDQTGSANNSIWFYFFDGSVWVNPLRNEQDWRSPTITSVDSNDANEVVVTATPQDRSGNVHTVQVRLVRGARAVEFGIVDWGSVTWESYFTAHYMNTSNSDPVRVFTSDGYIDGGIRTSGFSVTNQTDNWALFQGEDAQLDILFASTRKNFLMCATSAGAGTLSPRIRSDTQVAGSKFWVAAYPRAYTNGGSALSDSVVRQVEDYPQFTGFQPPALQDADGSLTNWTTDGRDLHMNDAGPRTSTALHFIGQSNQWAKYTFSTPQDWSEYRYLGVWARRSNLDGEAGDLALQVTDSNGNGAKLNGDAGGGGGSNYILLTGETWEFHALPIHLFTTPDLSSVQNFEFDCIDAPTGEEEFWVDHITLHTEDPSIGAEHGFIEAFGPEQDLVGWWKLDEASGTTAADASGEGNAGTINGGVTLGAAGQIGTAYTLDGSTGYVEVPDSASLSPTTALTLEAWVNGAAQSAYPRLVAKANQSSYADTDGFILASNTNNTANFDLGTGVGTATNITSTTAVLDGTWHHVVGTWDGSTAKLYVDGALENSGAYAGPLNDTTLPLVVGATSDHNSFFNGSIDDVRVYSRALGAAEVAKRYSEGAAGKESVRGWTATGTGSIEVVAGLNAGEKAIQGVASAANDDLQLDFPTPVDIRDYSNFMFWHKGDADAGYNMFLNDGSGNSIEFYFNPSADASWKLYSFNLNQPDIVSGQFDASDVVSMSFGATDAGSTHALTKFKLDRATASDDDWRLVEDANASGGYYVSNAVGDTTPSGSSQLVYAGSLGLNFPEAGRYYIAVRGRTDAANQGLTVRNDYGNHTVDLPTTTWANDPAWTVFGPYDAPAAGGKYLFVQSAGAWTVELDCIALIPVAETDYTPSSGARFPQNEAHRVLRQMKFL